jgi:tRNA G18 (ribose-2'-O)-methylase SpoU
MRGHAESLNAAVAAAVLLWEHQRQLCGPRGTDN